MNYKRDKLRCLLLRRKKIFLYIYDVITWEKYKKLCYITTHLLSAAAATSTGISDSDSERFRLWGALNPKSKVQNLPIALVVLKGADAVSVGTFVVAVVGG